MYLFASSAKIFPQAYHESGFFMRSLVGYGNGEIKDSLDNSITGTGIQTSLAIGWFIIKDLALHSGYSYSQFDDISFKGQLDEPARSGNYSYHAITGGLSYFFTSLDTYISIEVRHGVGGSYKLDGSISRTNESGETTTTNTRNKRTPFKEEGSQGGVSILIGTEEWLVTNDIGLGLAVQYSFDRPRRQVFYGILLSLVYN